MKISLDKLDYDILQLLENDGRMSFREIGHQLNKPESTIRGRYNTMVKSGALRVISVANPVKIGLDTMALIFCKVELNHLDTAIAALCDLPEIRFVAYTSGVYDLIIEVYLQSQEALMDFIQKKFSRVPGIRDYDLSIELKLFKDSYHWSARANQTLQEDK